MLMQRVAPCRAGGGIAKGVELQDRPLDPEFAQQLVGKAEQLDVGLRLTGTDDLGIELVELAEAALLRPFVAERRTMGRNLDRGMLLPAFGQVGAANAGRELRPQRDR